MSRGTIAYIDTKAANDNLALIQKKLPDTQIWAVVKANAYGHGAAKLAPKLNNCAGFAVATLNEALELRKVGIKKPILLLEGCVNLKQTKIALEHDCTLVLHCVEQIEEFATLDQMEASAKKKVWLKVDTGMHRLGVPMSILNNVYKRLADIAWVDQVGVMTHFACADEKALPFTEIQITNLYDCLPNECALVSMANSAAIFNYPDTALDWVRPGIALYGASPFTDISAQSLGLKPVMKLFAPIIGLREVSVGESIGYGKKWTAKRKSKIATVAIGYGDGYPRTCKQGAPVYVNGERAKLVGVVSMDLITIDVTDINVNLYDMVELWGENISVDEVAIFCGTIGYELLTRLSSRVEYQYE